MQKARDNFLISFTLKKIMMTWSVNIVLPAYLYALSFPFLHEKCFPLYKMHFFITWKISPNILLSKALILSIETDYWRLKKINVWLAVKTVTPKMCIFKVLFIIRFSAFLGCIIQTRVPSVKGLALHLSVADLSKKLGNHLRTPVNTSLGKKKYRIIE